MQSQRIQDREVSVAATDDQRDKAVLTLISGGPGYPWTIQEIAPRAASTSCRRRRDTPADRDWPSAQVRGLCIPDPHRSQSKRTGGRHSLTPLNHRPGAPPTRMGSRPPQRRRTTYGGAFAWHSAG